jgi:hypothetical protein
MLPGSVKSIRVKLKIARENSQPAVVHAAQLSPDRQRCSSANVEFISSVVRVKLVWQDNGV